MSTRMLCAPLLLASSLALAAGAPPTLSLDEAFQELDAKSLTLAQARERAGEADGLRRQALAGLLPTLVVGGNYTRNNEAVKLDLGGAINGLVDGIETGLRAATHNSTLTLERPTGLPGPIALQALEPFTGQATLRVPLFAANGYADYTAASEAAAAVGQSAQAARLTLKAALLQAAAWAQGAEDIAVATEAALGIAREHEASASRMWKAGTTERLSTLQAGTDVVRRESDLVRARADREKAWLALGILLGRAEPVRVALPPAADAPGPLAELSPQLSRAFELRPELKAQSLLLSSADAQVASAWWRLAPTLSGSVTGLVSNVPFITGLDYAWKATVDLSWPLYDGGFRYGKRVQAQSVQRGARAALEAQRLEVRQQVLDARREVEVAGQRLKLALQQKALAEEAQATAKRSFEAGLGSSRDVLDANDRLFQADVGLADARARVGMAAAALGRATGELLAP